jgi:hypothetical protein
MRCVPPQTSPPARNGQEVVPHRAAEGVCGGQMGVERGDEGVELGWGDLSRVSVNRRETGSIGEVGT